MNKLIPILALIAAGCTPDVQIADKVQPGEADTDAVDTDVVEEEIEEAGPAPDIEVTPANIDFGGWLPECPSTPYSIFISNVGDADLEVSEIEFRGLGQNSFLASETAGTIAPGDTLEVEIVFTPVRIDAYENPWVEVISNDPDEPSSRVDLRGEGATLALHTDRFIQEPADAVDVLFSIDHSGSMSSDIVALGNSFGTFIQSFVSLGLDFHIAVITADPDCPEFMGPVITSATADPVAEFQRQTREGSSCGGEAAFGASMNALAPAMLAGPNAGFLRTDANLAVVGISDEPEQTERANPGFFGCDPPFISNGCISVSSYVNFLVNLKASNPGKVTFSGVVAPRNASILGAFGGCDIAFPAPRYHEAIRRTGGVPGDLCALDLNPFLNHLSLVAAGLDGNFGLSRTPDNYNDITVEVGGVEVQESLVNGYQYDPTTNTITLYGDALPESGEEVVVIYPAETSCEQ